jgi:hypothetical protein
MLTRTLIALVIAIPFAGCNSSGGASSSPDAPNPACTNLAGSWAMQGTCGSDVCTFTQSACAITQLSCTSGAHSTNGSITGGQFTYTGVTGADVPATCNGSSAGSSMSGTCNVVGNTCTFSGARQ